MTLRIKALFRSKLLEILPEDGASRWSPEEITWSRLPLGSHDEIASGDAPQEGAQGDGALVGAGAGVRAEVAAEAAKLLEVVVGEFDAFGILMALHSGVNVAGKVKKFKAVQFRKMTHLSGREPLGGAQSHPRSRVPGLALPAPRWAFHRPPSCSTLPATPQISPKKGEHTMSVMFNSAMLALQRREEELLRSGVNVSRRPSWGLSLAPPRLGLPLFVVISPAPG